MERIYGCNWWLDLIEEKIVYQPKVVKVIFDNATDHLHWFWIIRAKVFLECHVLLSQKIKVVETLSPWKRLFLHSSVQMRWSICYKIGTLCTISMIKREEYHVILFGSILDAKIANIIVLIS